MRANLSDRPHSPQTEAIDDAGRGVLQNMKPLPVRNRDPRVIDGDEQRRKGLDADTVREPDRRAAEAEIIGNNTANICEYTCPIDQGEHRIRHWSRNLDYLKRGRSDVEVP